MPNRVLFICANNFSLSPLAAEILRQAAKQQGLDETLEVSSAGAFAGATPRLLERCTVEFAANKGLDLANGRTHQLTVKDCYGYHYLVIFREDVREFIKNLVPEIDHIKKIKRFVDLLGDLSLWEITDPVLDHASLERTYELLVRGCNALLRQLAASPEG